MNKLLIMLLCALLGHPMTTQSQATNAQPAGDTQDHQSDEQRKLRAMQNPLLRTPKLVDVTGESKKASAALTATEKKFIEQALAKAYADQAEHKRILNGLKDQYIISHSKNNSPKVESCLQLLLVTMAVRPFFEKAYMPSNPTLQKLVHRIHQLLYASTFTIGLRAIYKLVFNFLLEGGEQAAIASEEERLAFLAESIRETQELDYEHTSPEVKP